MFSRKIRFVAIRGGFYTLDFYKVWLQKIRFASIAEFRSDLILFEQSVSYLFLPPCIEEVCVMSKNNEKTQREGKWWIFWDRKYGVITLLKCFHINNDKFVKEMVRVKPIKFWSDSIEEIWCVFDVVQNQMV